MSLVNWTAPATETYKMVYQGTGEVFSNRDSVGSFGAGGSCTIVAILSREGNYIAHVDTLTKERNPIVFEYIHQYSHVKDSQVFLTKNAQSQPTLKEIMPYIPKDKKVVFGDDTSSLKVEQGKVTFDVGPTKQTDAESLNKQAKGLLDESRNLTDLFEKKGGEKERPPAPGQNFYFSVTDWKWYPRVSTSTVQAGHGTHYLRAGDEIFRRIADSRNGSTAHL